MSSRKTTKKKDEVEAPAAPPAPPPPSRWRAWFHPRVLAGTALLVTTVAFGPRVRDALPDLHQRREYRVPLDSVVVTPPPRWLPADFVPQALRDAGFQTDLPLLDDDVSAKVAAAFRQHPWVAGVERVRKTKPSGLAVDLTYRRPVAVVEVADGLYPIDQDGVLLPPADLAPADARRFLRILNVTTRPQGPAGAAWGDAHVAGAARLAAVLLDRRTDGEPLHRRYDVVAIRVPKTRSTRADLDDIGLELLTGSGSRVVWGRPPGASHPGELSVSQKIGRLDKYVRDYGGFDRPHGPYLIDITHWQEITRSALASGQPRSRN